jgi:type II secretory pathway predicted ATPase ExeA
MGEIDFGLTTRPFRTGLSTASYYPATGQEQALARLVRAIDEGEGLLLVTGEPGTGKTLLCHCLVERLGPQVTSAFLTNSHFPDRTALLQAILFDLALPYEGKTEQELRLTLTHYLLSRYGAGRPTLLIVDEAQNLTPDLFEELRLLGNLEGEQGRALQVILVAQPDIGAVLDRPEMAGLRQRLAVRVHLEPLGLHEAADYLLHHLRAAGGRPEGLMADEALAILARGTRGIPRLLNQAAQQALDLAGANGAASVDAEAALEALASLGLETELEDSDQGFSVAADDPQTASEGESLPGRARLVTPEEESASWESESDRPQNPFLSSARRPA